MFDSLLIQNFQSHKNSKLNFHPGVNVIVGLSDSGKSAIIRALRLVIKNRPLGDFFRSNWGGSTSVSLKFDNSEITRLKTSTENGYILKIKDSIYTLDAIKTEVPKEISDVLNMTDVNLQQQLDSPFLLTDSAGEVARHFNKIANLDQIDIGLQNVQKGINEISTIIGKEKQKDKSATGLHKQISDYEIELTKFENLDELESEIEFIEHLEITKNKNIQDVKELELLISKYHKLEFEITQYSNLISIEDAINDLLHLIKTKQEKEKDLTSMTNLIDELHEIEKLMKINENIISCESLIISCIDLRNSLNNKISDVNNFQKIIFNAKNISKEIKNSEMEFDRLHSLFEKEMGDTCILCGSKL